MNNKLTALATFLECAPDELCSSEYPNAFEKGNEYYLVLSDDEANEYTRQRILESLWAFNADFILSNSKIECDEKEEKDILKALKLVQEKLCESANPLIRALIKDEDEFVEAAIDADGRGHFLAGYDFEENESNGYFIYRDN